MKCCQWRQTNTSALQVGALDWHEWILWNAFSFWSLWFQCLSWRTRFNGDNLTPAHCFSMYGIGRHICRWVHLDREEWSAVSHSSAAFVNVPPQNAGRLCSIRERDARLVDGTMETCGSEERICGIHSIYCSCCVDTVPSGGICCELSSSWRCNYCSVEPVLRSWPVNLSNSELFLLCRHPHSHFISCLVSIWECSSSQRLESWFCKNHFSGFASGRIWFVFPNNPG